MKTIKTPIKSEINITCRGCKKVYEFKNEIPVEMVCSKCGYLIAKDGFIWPED